MPDFEVPSCPSCGFELKGRPLRGTCPKCRDEYSLSLPGLEPGRLPPTSRFQRFEYDAGLARSATIKAAALASVCIGIIAAWKASEAGGAQEGINFLIRYSITLAAALALYFVCCITGMAEYSGPLIRATLGIAGAVAASLLAQHLATELFVAIGTPILIGLSWMLSLIIFLGLAADLLDLDITEAAFLSIFVLGARLILKFAMFDQMFAK